MKDRVVYYTNEKSDNFSKYKIKTKKIDEDFKYYHYGILYNFIAFILYRLIAVPFAFIYCKLKLHLKIKNKKVLKKAKNTGYFLYLNHTQQIADAFIPSLASFPKKSYIISHADNVSLPIFKHITPMLGSLTLPNSLKTTRNFIDAIQKRILQEQCVAIYPEASIWPYHTTIRNFPATSFKYVIQNDVPCFCLTTTYKKRKFSSKANAVSYLDGPFYYNKQLASIKEQEKDLRDRVYSTMVERSKLNEYEYIKYVKVKEQPTTNLEIDIALANKTPN